jgi:dienelactone hydrolase
MLTRLSRITCFFVWLVLAPACFSQETIAFPSLDLDAAGQPVTLDGYLFLPEPYDASKRFPAVVFMHGCGGLLTRAGKIDSRETDWARRLSKQGYVVLAVDSFTTRNQGSECAGGGPVRPQTQRPLDAYGALRYLQHRADVTPNRVALIGWSHGGGTVLFAIGPQGPAQHRPNQAQGTNEPEEPESDFRAAVAFYPGWCNDKAQHAADWNTTVPLLILTEKAMFGRARRRASNL